MADEEKLKRLEQVEQALHAQSAQRAAMQSQLLEIENAHGALATSPEAWRVIGNIMVKADAETLKKELAERKESMQARMSSVERSETRLRDELKRLQQEILGGSA